MAYFRRRRVRNSRTNRMTAITISARDVIPLSETQDGPVYLDKSGRTSASTKNPLAIAHIDSSKLESRSDRKAPLAPTLKAAPRITDRGLVPHLCGRNGHRSGYHSALAKSSRDGTGHGLPTRGCSVPPLHSCRIGRRHYRHYSLARADRGHYGLGERSALRRSGGLRLLGNYDVLAKNAGAVTWGLTLPAAAV